MLAAQRDATHRPSSHVPSSGELENPHQAKGHQFGAKINCKMFIYVRSSPLPLLPPLLREVLENLNSHSKSVFQAMSPSWASCLIFLNFFSQSTNGEFLQFTALLLISKDKFVLFFSISNR